MEDMYRLRRIMLLIAMVALFPLHDVMMEDVQATDFSTQCKWGLPWDEPINYYLYNSRYDSGVSPLQFSFDNVLRIAYGANVWSEANFNLRFQEWRTLKDAAYNQAPNNTTHFSWVHRGHPGADVPADTVARVLAWDQQGNQIQYGNPCNMDQGNPIVAFNIIFNQNVGFYEDCLANPQHCSQNNLFDFHAVAAHEFGHTFMLLHSATRWESWSWACFGDHACDTTMAGRM